MDSRRQEKDFPQTKPDAWLKMATTFNAAATAMEAESAAYSEATTYFREAAAVMRVSITPDVSVAPLGSQNILQEPNRVYSFVQPAPVELEKDSSP
jgi:purine-nucleoside phosphorylase